MPVTTLEYGFVLQIVQVCCFWQNYWINEASR